MDQSSPIFKTQLKRVAGESPEDRSAAIKRIASEDKISLKTTTSEPIDVTNQLENAGSALPIFMENLLPLIRQTIADTVAESITALSDTIIRPLTEQLKSQSTIIAQMNQKLLENDALLKELKQENGMLRRQMVDMKTEVNGLQQQSRKYNIRMFNALTITNNPSESEIKKLVSEFFLNKLHVKISTQDIDRAHPLKVGVIVKFRNYEDKVNVLKARRQLKNTNIRVVEDLSQTNYRIYKEALGLRQEKKLASVWSRDGKVYVKKGLDTRPLRIMNNQQLNTL